MTDSFISFQAREVDATQLNDVFLHYLAYERLRTFRRDLMLRLGGFLLIGWLFSLELHLLPGIAVIGIGAAVVALIAAAVLAEQRARRIFTTFLCSSRVFRRDAPKTS